MTTMLVFREWVVFIIFLTILLILFLWESSTGEYQPTEIRCAPRGYPCSVVPIKDYRL